MPTFDTLIKGGTVIDGSGAAPRTADVGITDGMITAVGEKLGSASETINADGLLVTPGWVDIHTHYDAQATWDSELKQSTWHGVTSAIAGNCGVGFAPARPDRHRWLINLMEGVEDIPGVSLEAGMEWRWESFPEYMDALDDFPRTIDFGTQMTHGALRAYVMGQRGADNEAATADDLKRMSELVTQGMAAGALGFTTSRTEIHIDIDGHPVPGTYAGVEELTALAKAVKSSGHGLMEMVLAGVAGEDCDALDRDMALVRKVAEASDCRMMYLQVQHNADADQWQRQLKVCEDAAAAGLEIIPQVPGRPISLLLTMAGEHPWRFMPSYREIADLPTSERLKRMAEPAMRARLLAEEDPNETGFSLFYKDPTLWDMTYPGGNPINYTPDPATSVTLIAKRENRPPAEVAYDLMLENDGNNILMHAATGYANRNTDAVHSMLTHPLSVFGLSDAGAHCRFICDGGVHTYMLMNWSRDLPEDHPHHLPLSEVVKKMTGDNARLYGLHDRGVLRPGLRADINLIDLPNLASLMPEMVFDLPAGQPRLLGGATGYVGTWVHGKRVLDNGNITDARPGRVMRGA